MRTSFVAALCVGLCLSGCGGSEEYASEEAYAIEEISTTDDAAGDAAPENEFGFSEALAPAPSPFGEAGGDAEVVANIARNVAASGNTGPTDSTAQVEPTDGAQIAYSYSYGYRVDAERVGALQQRHAALCEKMGPRRCRVLNLSRAGSDGDGYGDLKLRVAASEARAFGGALDKAAEEVGGEQVSFGLSGEDLTETIIDTEAHLGSRRVLRERLLEILRTRQGSVADLVQAENAVAEVNEEIDSAASQLAQLRNRVQMSRVSIEYGPNVAVGSRGFARPIGAALSSVSTTLGVTIAAIIYIAVALVPIIAFLLLLRWLWRRSGLRLRRERPKPAEEQSAG